MPANIIHGIEAVTIHIRDIEKARAFYRDVLGLREVQFNAEASRSVFAVPGSPTVLAMHVKAPGELGREPGTVTGVIFAVADVNAACQALRQAGATITDEPVTVTMGGNNFLRAAFADPDGNEFLLRARAA